LPLAPQLIDGVAEVFEARQRELLSAGHDAALLRWQAGTLLPLLALLRAAGRAAGARGGGLAAGPPAAQAALQQRARALALALSEVGCWRWEHTPCVRTLPWVVRAPWPPLIPLLPAGLPTPSCPRPSRACSTCRS
jgi:hypothetical protein